MVHFRGGIIIMTVEKMVYLTNRDSVFYDRYYRTPSPRNSPIMNEAWMNYTSLIFWLDAPCFVYRWNTLQSIIQFVSDELSPDHIVTLDDICGVIYHHDNIYEFQSKLLAKSHKVTSGEHFDHYKMYRPLVTYHFYCGKKNCNSPHYKLTMAETQYRYRYSKTPITQKIAHGKPTKFNTDCPNYTQSGNCFYQQWCRFKHTRTICNFSNKYHSDDNKQLNDDDDTKYLVYDDPPNDLSKLAYNSDKQLEEFYRYGPRDTPIKHSKDKPNVINLNQRQIPQQIEYNNNNYNNNNNLNQRAFSPPIAQQNKYSHSNNYIHPPNINDNDNNYNNNNLNQRSSPPPMNYAMPQQTIYNNNNNNYNDNNFNQRISPPPMNYDNVLSYLHAPTDKQSEYTNDDNNSPPDLDNLHLDSSSDNYNNKDEEKNEEQLTPPRRSTKYDEYQQKKTSQINNNNNNNNFNNLNLNDTASAEQIAYKHIPLYRKFTRVAQNDRAGIWNQQALEKITADKIKKAKTKQDKIDTKEIKKERIYKKIQRAQNYLAKYYQQLKAYDDEFNDNDDENTDDEDENNDNSDKDVIYIE